MTTHTPSDARVPNIGPRFHYLLLGIIPTWIYHVLDTGNAMAGDAPETATTDAAHTDPSVHAGIATFSTLTKGGYFSHLGDYKRPVVVEAIDNPAGATITIVNPVLSTSRAAPATYPFKIGPNEYLKAVTATTGSRIGFLVREDIPAR